MGRVSFSTAQDQNGQMKITANSGRDPLPATPMSVTPEFGIGTRFCQINVNMKDKQVPGIRIRTTIFINSRLVFVA